ncbi:MAG: aldehyde dehydrogenase family protein [Bdellovibrionaceae bacterium]|nr:aldehyde dehydrogenase family protein [Bdellovibrionales bacterium]MCB9254908.1 aldehyde dehydrogenase family protein [Pseudobdellovibrionaceae bacterium]
MEATRSYRGDYIKGHFVKVSDPNGEVLSKNPGDLDQPVLSFPFSYEHVGDVIDAARAGFATWKRMPASDRYAALSRYRGLLQERKKEVSEMLSFEGGGPLWEAESEVNESLQLLEFYLGQPSETEVERKLEHTNEMESVFRYYPKGPMVVISPSTLPLLISHSRFVPALLNGNSVVLKSSKFNPAVGQMLAEIANDAGIPSGVFNVIHGDAELSRRLIGHKDVQGVFFTGSHEKALRIRKELVNDYWKTLVINSGGKNGIVVWKDACYEKALKESLYSAYLTTGQRYTSTRRLLIHADLFDRFLEDFHNLSKKVRVDYGLLPDRQVFMGPLVSEAKMENYLRYQGIAVREGCEEIMRGKHLEKERRGYYVSPSIHLVKTLNPKSIYQRDMIFGPNIAIYKIQDLDEVPQVLNQSPDGLVASLYSASRETYARLLGEVEVGLFHWNCPTVSPVYRLPFVGLKRSGNGRPMGTQAYLQCTNPMSSLELGAEAVYPHLPANLPKL